MPQATQTAERPPGDDEEDMALVKVVILCQSGLDETERESLKSLMVDEMEKKKRKKQHGCGWNVD